MANPVSASRDADVIVVGAGHNGLIAACYLARAGLDVLVVEAFEKIGGMTNTNPMVPEAPDHLINEGGIQATLFLASTIDAELELSSKFGLRMRHVDPFHVQLGPDGESLAMWRDYRRTAEEIRYFSPKDAEAWLKFCRTVDAAIKIGIPMMRTNPVKPEMSYLLKAIGAAISECGQFAAMAKWLPNSADEAVHERFEHPLVRGPMLPSTPFGNFRADFSGWQLIYYGICHRFGAAMFEGGSQAFPAALYRCLEAAGGRVRTSAPVEQLIVKGGRVAGVRLQGGEEILARKAVVTSLNPKMVLGRMLPAGVLSDDLTQLVERIPTKNRGITDYLLNIALKGKITLPRHQAWRNKKDGLDLRLPVATWTTQEEALEACDACLRGEVPKVVPGVVQMNTAFDPSLAPPGHDTLWYYSGVTPQNPRIGWEKAREEITNNVVNQIKQYYSGIDEFEIGRRTALVPDFENRFWALDGNLWHVDTFMSRSGPLKPARGLAGYKTPVDGLFITGSGTHPVAGICGIPGQIAARVVLKNVRK